MKRINITCPACGSRAYLRPASVVYGDKAPDPDAKYYVCGRYPACDCYVAAHRKTMLPMGTLADKALRKKRHDAHVALDSLWKNGIMSRKEAYRLLQLSMGLPAEDAHIARYVAFLCVFPQMPDTGVHIELRQRLLARQIFADGKAEQFDGPKPL